MSSTEDWLLEILEAVRIGGWLGAEPDSREPNYLDTDVAESKIRQHMLSEAMGLLGEDDNEVRGTTQSPDNPNYWTKRTKHRNELKAELRKAFTEKYGERE